MPFDSRTPPTQPWNIANQRLGSAGVTPAQVQAVFLKQVLSIPTTTSFPAHATLLADALVAIAQNLQQKYPNVQQCFVTSRIYGGYSLRPERTEPLTYETGFAVRDLVLRQINGDPALNFDPDNGPVMAPWITWGPYIWGDGIRPRADGLIWRCDDLVDDGIHPSQSGRLQVADLIGGYFRTSIFSTWYSGPLQPATAGVLPYGSSCVGSPGQPNVMVSGTPFLGNASYAIGANGMVRGASAAVLLGTNRDRLPLASGCSFWVDLTNVLAVGHAVASNGQTLQPLPIPSDPALGGARVYTQWLALDPEGTAIPGLGGVAMTPGQLHQIGMF